MKNLIFLLTIAWIFSACSKNETQPQPESEPLTLSYDSTTLVGSFYQQGISGSPEINWQGDSGIFKIVTSTEHITIDSSTGVISWDKQLPVGLNSVGVAATNSSGDVQITVEILNQFGGEFRGGLSKEFDPDVFPNKMVVVFLKESKFTSSAGFNEAIGVGKWWLDEEMSNVKVTYNIVGIEGKTSLQTENIVLEKSGAYIEGFWFKGEFPSPGSIISPEGSFRFNLIIKKE